MSWEKGIGNNKGNSQEFPYKIPKNSQLFRRVSKNDT